MKRLFLSCVVAATIFATFAVPAQAANAPLMCPPPVPGQTTSCTLHLTDFSPPPMTVKAIVCPDGSVVPSGSLASTFETGVFHITINGAGDLWLTTTVQGTFTFTAAPSGTVYTGHFMQWFGTEANNMNFVTLGNLTYVGTSASGALLNLHLVFHLSISASGQVNFFMNATC